MKNRYLEFLHHIFSDVYARQNNWLTRIDVRVKLFYIVSMLLINVWARNVFLPVFFFFVSFALLLSVRIPLSTILRRMLLPLSFAVLIFIIKGLHEGERTWMTFSLAGYKLALKEEGLQSGLLVCGKVLGGISLVIILSFTTTIGGLCIGLKWFRMPNTLVELLAFMYRYIFLLVEEVSTMWNAQKSRLGHATWRKMIQSFGPLGGMLIIRTFERAERTYEAMQARGYEGGSVLTIHLSSWERKEYLYVLGIVLALPLLIYTGNMQIW